MAEPAIGGPSATDHFGLSALWVPVSSSVDDNQQYAYALDSAGYYTGSQNQAYDKGNAYTARYRYIGADSIPLSSTTAGMPKPGQFKTAALVDRVEVEYSNTDWPHINVTGHQHDSNAHDTDHATFSSTLTLTAGFGVPDLLTNAASATSSPTSARVVLSANHVDINKSNGEHLAGVTIDGREELELEYEGTPTLTTTGWQQMSNVQSDGNEDFDKNSFSFLKIINKD